MKKPLMVALALVAGCSQTNPTGIDISVVETSSGDPNSRETEIRFRIPPESAIRVTYGSGEETLYTDRLNSEGLFAIRLGVTRNKLSMEGSHRFTTFVHVGRPGIKVSGSSISFTFSEDRTFEDVLRVTTTSGSIPLGAPHLLGTLDGKPVTLLVQPGVGMPRLATNRRLEFANPSVGFDLSGKHATHKLQ
jgi:hypothetical protein